MKVNRLTPILIVEEIEPCLELWVDRLGFEKTAEVPFGDKLGFVMLQRDGFEIMYQTRASVEEEAKTSSLSKALVRSAGQGVLYLDVDDLDEVRRSVEGLNVVFPDRETSYGMRELWLVEPGGNVVGFAARQK